MKKFTLILLSYCVFAISSAQTTAITETGDTIIINSNGTWESLHKAPKVAAITSTVKAEVEIDEFKGTKKTSTELWTSFGSNDMNKTIAGSLFRVDNLTVFTIMYTGDLGCLSKHSSSILVKLTTGDIIEFAQMTDTDCGDYPSAKFIPVSKEQLKDPEYKTILEDNLSLLKNYDWVSLRINGTEYYTDMKPKISKKTPHPEQFFRQHLIAADNL